MTQSLQIDVAMARTLIDTQFPNWQHLTIKPVAQSGWDNRTFHLGSDMLIRIPSAPEYAAQVEKEQYWLPKLAPSLPLSIPHPLALGKPSADYPWSWSIYHWLPGKSMNETAIENRNHFALSLAQFLKALWNIDSTGGPAPGEQNFHRGGNLTVYEGQTKKAIDLLESKMNASIANAIWEQALSTAWQNQLVWVHGDISPGNLLVNQGKLSAVIDFGQLAVGDPACDLAIGFTVFQGASRGIFFETLGIDANTILRAKAWAL